MHQHKLQFSVPIHIDIHISGDKSVTWHYVVSSWAQFIGWSQFVVHATRFVRCVQRKRWQCGTNTYNAHHTLLMYCVLLKTFNLFYVYICWRSRFWLFVVVILRFAGSSLFWWTESIMYFDLATWNLQQIENVWWSSSFRSYWSATNRLHCDIPIVFHHNAIWFVLCGTGSIYILTILHREEIVAISCFGSEHTEYNVYADIDDESNNATCRNSVSRWKYFPRTEFRTISLIDRNNTLTDSHFHLHIESASSLILAKISRTNEWKKIFFFGIVLDILFCFALGNIFQ